MRRGWAALRFHDVVHHEWLRAMYDAFNARELDAVLRRMTDDVDWPNAWEGGRVLGREGVRDYWTRQWAEIDPTVDPVEITTRPDGGVAVRVHQVARNARRSRTQRRRGDARLSHPRRPHRPDGRRGEG